MTTTTWGKPGPGTWELDSSHCGPAPGPIQRALYEECLEAGMREGFSLFGAPLSHMEMRWVHGKFYRRLVPIVGANVDRPPPPAPVLRLVSRIHPAFRRNEKRARESFAVKRWRDELRRWEDEWKPSIVERNRAFTAVDVGALGDEALAAHVLELFEHLRATTRLHFRLHVSDMGPLGNLMLHLTEWGLAGDDVFRALVAASPATREPARLLRSVAEALPDPAAITSLDDVRAVPAASERLDAYLADHGWRMTTGYDLEDRCLAELPDVLLASIRAAARPAVERTHEEALATLREEVPPEHRATFDDLVEDARLSYGLRDENGPLTYEWPLGLLRRALLEAGERLAAAGRVGSADRVFELDAAEVAGLLRGGAAPTKDEVERRADHRRWEASLVAPPVLGPEVEPPSPDLLPPNLARLTRIVLLVVGALEAKPGRAALTGMGVGEAPHTGTARVVHDAVEALATMEPGDVVVAPYTAPTYNAVLAMAGAIVTEQGGPLCHAAVIARELGIPAVIGAAGAMTSIPDGATVVVDPGAGTVRLL